jgi:hypothetical protein
MFLRYFRRLSLLCIIILVFAMPVAAQAPFTVSDGGDAVDIAIGDGVCDSDGAAGEQCTLRAAVQEANANPSSNTIIVTVPLVTLSLAGTGEDASANGDLDITAPLEITGSVVTIQVLHQERAFHVSAPITASLFGFSITGVRTADDGGAVFAGSGANLTLRSVHAHHNSAPTIFAAVNANNVTIDQSSFAFNSVNAGTIKNNGSADFVLRNSTVTQNAGSSVGGVSMVSSDSQSVALDHVTITANTSYGTQAEHVGGIFIGGDGAPTIRNSIIGGNTALANGAADDCYTVPASFFISGSGNVFYADMSQTCTFFSDGDRSAYDLGLLPLEFNAYTGMVYTGAGPLSAALFFGASCPDFDMNSQPRPAVGCTSGALEAPTRQLIVNGGFEGGLSGWTVAGAGTKAKITDPHTGLKHLEFKGTTGTSRSITQKVKFNDGFVLQPSYIVLDLYARGMGQNAVLNVTLQFGSTGRKVKLTRTLINKTSSAEYERFTERLIFDAPVPPVGVLPRQLTDLTSVSITLTDKSLSKSKVYVDDVMVYLYGGSIQSGPRTDAVIRSGGVLPPPAAPEGFRGSN